ncbi:MAG: tRNA 2-thiouridine(34) synthase MnmA [Gammaproteobacteria bacterium]|nr:tRNA 2-thiouridine(34) synthase MnmA [Gammaproteobacteria bacterium]
MNKQQHIIVGMSGGVDSSVAALLLHQQGYRTEGIFMKNWDDYDEEYPCTAKEEAMEAMAVCEKMGIEMDAITFVEEYRDRVFKYFLDEYKKGRTPNPDILCNKEIKFKAFLEYALNQGADFIATGHYARITKKKGLYQLLKGIDQNKDQSYFLYTLGQEQLAKVLFPLGSLIKTEVRKIAKKADLPNFDKKDSTGICFIGERRFKPFLTRYLGTQPGNICDIDNDIIGQHDGLMFYTLGQRQGLGIGGNAKGSGEPWFVLDKDLSNNTLIVGQGHNHPRLLSSALKTEMMHWVSGTAPRLPFRCYAKTRYRQTDQACTISEYRDHVYTVNFAEPQRAVTPGQSVVFYEGDICLGGGVITESKQYIPVLS